LKSQSMSQLVESWNQMLSDLTANPIVVYSVPHEGYIIRTPKGRWMTKNAVNLTTAVVHMCSQGWPAKEARAYVRDAELLPKVHGFDLRPNQPQLFQYEDGTTWLNTWVPPTVIPTPGEFPVIERVISWMAKDDAHGAAWLVNWMAYKVQNPMAVPKVAVVFATAPGAGKGFLARVLSEILGTENCAVVKQHELENRFNSRWVQKLFVLGDEILSSDNTKDISNYLKILIDGNDLELEAKGVDQITIKSKLAWMFASNDKISPVILESNDRRYSVYTNHTDMPEDYKAALRECFEIDRTTCTPAFEKEIAAFAEFLLRWAVDANMLMTPFANTDRAELIEANKPSYETFFDELEREGLDGMVGTTGKYSGIDGLPGERSEWDFGDKGILCLALYKLYQKHCRDTGARSLKRNKFGHAVKNRGWTRAQLYRSKKSTVWVYVPPAR